MKKTILFSAAVFAYFLLQTAYCFSQGTAINSTGAKADNSAMLDVSSTTKGTLITRMNTTERNGIFSPAEGLLIYNTTTQCYEGYNSANMQWVSFGCIGCQLPGSFTAAAASNITAVSFSANWTASSGASGYFLDVSTEATFSSFVSGYNNLGVGNYLTANVTGLTCSTTYYYRVRSDNSCGTSPNTNTVSAQTAICFTCGNPFTDSRDSKTYNTVIIGTQCWMAENLSYGTYVDVAVGGQAPAGTQKYCQNFSGFNDMTCPIGGLYEWDEMMDGAAGCNGSAPPPDANVKCSAPVQGICPDGWHIPSHYEWTLMEKNAGSAPGAFPYNTTTTGWLGSDEGSNLKEPGTTHWNSPNNCTPPGTCNSKGFTALPGGVSLSGTFANVHLNGSWWTSTDYNSSYAWERDLNYSMASIARNNNYTKDIGLSVRCVKD